MIEAFSKNAIVSVSIVLEAALLLLAVVWMHYSNVELASRFHFVATPFYWGLAVASVSSLASLACFSLGKHVFFLKGLRKMSEEFLAPLIAKLGAGDIVLLSLVSGFCEEVLFRGIIQAQFGLYITALVFGIFHDPSFKQRAYVIMAALAGLGLGYLYQQTGNLWSCITAHTVHNLCAMLVLRYCIKPAPDSSAG